MQHEWRRMTKLLDDWCAISPYTDASCFQFEENQSALVRARDTHLIVTITGNLDARLPHLHVHHQTFHHRQCVLVVTKVLQRGQEIRWRHENRFFLFFLKKWWYQVPRCVPRCVWQVTFQKYHHHPAHRMHHFGKRIWGKCYFQQHIAAFKRLKINSTASTGRETQSAYCEQVHDCVTRLSKKGFSEANAEQRTRINCKTKWMTLMIINKRNMVPPLPCIACDLFISTFTIQLSWILQQNNANKEIFFFSLHFWVA